jgi:phage shock protein PspC (stress-responsive transcriptional regulator)
MRRFHLSTLDKKIAGVCGGLGDYFTLDPLLFRIAFVVLAFTTFPSILAYIILWLVMGNNQ